METEETVTINLTKDEVSALIKACQVEHEFTCSFPDNEALRKETRILASVLAKMLRLR